MTQKNNNKIISVMHPICCGLDVHKKMVSACIIITEPDGEKSFVVKEFSTFTDDLFRLKSWLLSHACNVVAMESTSVYWRPVHNVLELFYSGIAFQTIQSCQSKAIWHIIFQTIFRSLYDQPIKAMLAIIVNRQFS
jgi:hypothetical protein